MYIPFITNYNDYTKLRSLIPLDTEYKIRLFSFYIKNISQTVKRKIIIYGIISSDTVLLDIFSSDDIATVDNKILKLNMQKSLKINKPEKIYCLLILLFKKNINLEDIDITYSFIGIINYLIENKFNKDSFAKTLKKLYSIKAIIDKIKIETYIKENCDDEKMTIIKNILLT